jgi:hypothetical protein
MVWPTLVRVVAVLVGFYLLFWVVLPRVAPYT